MSSSLGLHSRFLSSTVVTSTIPSRLLAVSCGRALLSPALNRSGGMLKRFSCIARRSTLVKPPKVLVTGALGQVGQELVPYLRSAYGAENVISSDVKAFAMPKVNGGVIPGGPFRRMDVLNPTDLSQVVKEEGITTIVHLAAILSARGEQNPLLALKINNEGTQNVLEAAARSEHDIKVFIPSTIAVFGPSSPKEKTPDDCVMRPTTMYGITKIHAELLGEYYHNTFGVDFRSLRYPGVISTKQMPGGGTTDYAVEVFHDAVKRRRYSCYLKKDTVLPFIYMPDLLKGTLQLLEADEARLSRRTYNLGAMSFSPEQLGSCIGHYLEDFVMDYKPDFRQDIADTWPRHVDFTAAKKDWGWNPDYDLDNMTREILGLFLRQHAEELSAKNIVPSEYREPVIVTV